MQRPAGPRLAEAAPPDFVLGALELPPPATAQDQPPHDQPPHDGPTRQRRRRRRAGNLPAGSRPAFIRITDPVLRWGPLALLAFAPLAWGSVEAWSETVVVAGSSAIGAIWLLRLAFFPECTAADRSASGHIGTWSAGLHLPLLAVLGVGLLQLVPFGGLAAALSPVGAEIQRQAGLEAGSLTLTMARQQTHRALALFAGLALLFFAVFDGLPGRAEVRRLAVAFVALGFVHAVGGILWHYQSGGRAYWGTTAGGGSFGPYINRNHFACLMGMTVPLGIGFLLSLGHRRPDGTGAPGGDVPAANRPSGSERRSQLLLFGFVVAVMAGALGLSLSRGGMVSTLAALSVFALVIGARRLTRGHVWKAAAAVAAACAFTVWLVAQPLFDRLGTITDSQSVTARTGIWEDTLRIAADFPLFGTGFGTFAEVYPRYQTAHAGGTVQFAHNDWVQLLAEGGLAGTLAVLVLIGGYAAAAAKRLGRRRDREAVFLALGGLGGLLAFLLHSFTEFNAHIPANALWFTVLAALALKSLSSRTAAVPVEPESAGRP
jgi:O-antigen ligase